MATKKELTTEELQAQYDAIGAELEARRKTEAEEREAKLAAEKESRYAEIQELERKIGRLKIAYIKDYGSYSTTRAYRSGNTSSLWDYFFDEV